MLDNWPDTGPGARASKGALTWTGELGSDAAPVAGTEGQVRHPMVNGPEDVTLSWGAVGWRHHEDNVRRLRQQIFTGLLELLAVKAARAVLRGRRAQQCARRYPTGRGNARDGGSSPDNVRDGSALSDDPGPASSDEKAYERNRCLTPRKSRTGSNLTDRGRCAAHDPRRCVCQRGGGDQLRSRFVSPVGRPRRRSAA
jgi:hypothetical protein